MTPHPVGLRRHLCTCVFGGDKRLQPKFRAIFERFAPDHLDSSPFGAGLVEQEC
jgi:hypothetical protein